MKICGGGDIDTAAHVQDLRGSSMRHISYVQPHGFLLSVRCDFDAPFSAPTVRRVSANLGALTGVPAASALGAPLSRVLAPDSVLTVTRAIELSHPRPPPAAAAAGLGRGPVDADCSLRLAVVTVNGAEWTGLLYHTKPPPAAAGAGAGPAHVHAGCEAILELEPAASPFNEPARLQQPRDGLAGLSARAMTIAQGADSAEALAQALLPKFADIVAFDRCMIYRFDSQNKGQVISESLRNPAQASFLGMCFPQLDMDIPPIGAPCDLLLLKPFLELPDVNAAPAAVLSAGAEAPLDLARSCSSLRAVSPGQVQHLKSMGVRAAMVLGIVVANRLWGLLVCHHCSPKYCNHLTRLACSNFVMVLASQIAWVQERQCRSAEDHLRPRELVQSSIALDAAQKQHIHMIASESSARTISNNAPCTRELLPCAGVALVSAASLQALEEAARGEEICELHCSGTCPNQDELLNLAIFLERKCSKMESHGQEPIFFTNCWSRDIPSNIRPTQNIRGLLACRLSKGSIAMFFREELQCGNGQSKAFTPTDVDSAAALRHGWAILQQLGVSRQVKIVSQELTQLLEAVTVPVITLCREGRIADWNPKAEETFGLERAAAMGKPLVETIVNPSRAEEARQVIADAAVGKFGKLEVEFTTQNPSDRSMPLEILMRAITRQDARSGIVGVRCICTDLTERKRTMKAQMGAEETRKFLSTMSHEMRTPLNGVLGMLQLAKDFPIHPSAAEYIDGAMRSGELLLTLINDILDINRIEAGAMVLASTRFDIARLANSTAMIVQPKAASKDIRVTVVIPTPLPDVYGDPERLQQILLNFLSNAVKFTHNGGRVLMQVYPKRWRGNVVDVRIDVIDNGPGIGEEDQLQLFQRFYRVRDRSREDPGGTGLGLAICQEIATRWGGKVGCESSRGYGSTFWVQLPMKFADDDGPPRHDSASVISSRLQASLLSRELSADPSSPHPNTDTGPLPSVSDTSVSAPVPDLLLDLPAGLVAGPRVRDRRFSAADVELCAKAVMALHDAQAGALEVGLGLPRGAVSRRQPVEAVEAAATLIDSSSGARSRRSSDGSVSGFAAVPDATPPAPPPTNHQSPALQATTLGCDFCRVLVVDDNPINVRVVKAMLERAGHTVVVACDGQEAVEAFRCATAAPELQSPESTSNVSSSTSAPPNFTTYRRSFDLILMDCEMPRKDGFAATREIRAMEEAAGAAHIPIIALTANVLPEDEKRCYEAGMNSHISKPIIRHQLLDAVSKYATPPDLASLPVGEPAPDLSESLRAVCQRLAKLSSPGRPASPPKRGPNKPAAAGER